MAITMLAKRVASVLWTALALALTMAAVFLLMSYNLWLFFMQKQAPGAVQGALNLLFFLYLVREDVRKRLR